MSSAYRAILTKCNIKWYKVSHLRLCGMEQASAHGGLDADEIATMSKHKKDKIFRYITQLKSSVLRVMSGFEDEKEDYNVPRCNLDYEGAAFLHGEKPENILFPMYQTWLSQFRSRNGDEGAEEFLLDVIPFISRVIIQDGIYWIERYPQNPASLLLLHVLGPEYKAWAARAREELKNREIPDPQDLVEIYNGATQGVCRSVMYQLNDIKAGQEEIKKGQQEICQRLSMVERERNTSTTTMTTQIVTTMTTTTVAHEQPRSGQSMRQERRINDVLAYRPSLHQFRYVPKELPSTMRQLLMEHDVTYKLVRLTDVPKRDWTGKERTAFSRRHYLYEQLRARANRMTVNLTFEQKKDRAAEQMDKEMSDNSISSTAAYHEFLKARDPTRKTRKRKAN